MMIIIIMFMCGLLLHDVFFFFVILECRLLPYVVVCHATRHATPEGGGGRTTCHAPPDSCSSITGNDKGWSCEHPSGRWCSGIKPTWISPSTTLPQPTAHQASCHRPARPPVIPTHTPSTSTTDITMCRQISCVATVQAPLFRAQLADLANDQ